MMATSEINLVEIAVNHEGQDIYLTVDEQTADLLVNGEYFRKVVYYK